LIEDSLHSQKILAASADIEMQTVLPYDLPDVSADRDRILQVFENLIGNAIKFTKPGGKITVSAEAQAEDVRFSVADSGTGIPEADLPHLFDRFWQASKEKGRGAGLGLAIVKGIVEAHGGRIWVTSALGNGTTFFFTIPSVPTGAIRGMEPRSDSPGRTLV
jgi:signal transduction histidine kinase